VQGDECASHRSLPTTGLRLADPEVRVQWCETIDKAIDYLTGYSGELAELAAGRMAELMYLKRALMHLNRK
jgi:hypothetical protein